PRVSAPPPPLPARMVISGVPEKPGCVEPSTNVGVVIAGRSELIVMVCAPEPIANVIVFDPPMKTALAMASRSEPAPESDALVTVNVVAWQARENATTKNDTRQRIKPG